MTSRTLTILHETPDWVAVIKPAELATIPGRGEDDSVLEQLGRQLGLPSSGAADPRIRVVHRLDKDTSGVLLFAKNAAAQRRLSGQFMRNTVQKQYLALVAGTPETEEGEIDAPLARHPHDPKRMAVVKHGGRPTKTAWKIERRFRAFTLLRVFPKTGKTHQIRVHLKHIGVPLAIDPLYGSRQPIYLSRFKRDYRPTRGQKEFPLIDRLTLHAEVLEFDGMDGARVRLECPPPKDLRATINQLGKLAGR